ncbi:MAG: imidazole glycerol phosphate synthase subunit HisH [Thermoplasmata archaeon]
MSDDTLILDLGIGNIANVRKVTGGKIGHDTYDIHRAGKIILPGVGNFGEVMERLEPLRDHILEAAAEGKYILGICLGMQLFFNTSEERSGRGLGLLNGEVSRFRKVRTPHIGWNQLWINKECPILKDVPDGSYFYFVHSYYVEPEEPDIVAGSTEYGSGEEQVSFPSVVWDDNVFGVQFHPEKSSEKGLRMLKNFRELRT